MILSNKKLANPFVYQGYESPEYFCDRETETKTLLSHLKNGRNITLINLKEHPMETLHTEFVARPKEN
jgi:uncharacterized protein